MLICGKKLIRQVISLLRLVGLVWILHDYVESFVQGRMPQCRKYVANQKGLVVVFLDMGQSFGLVPPYLAQ